jgi:hypothetical protein
MLLSYSLLDVFKVQASSDSTILTVKTQVTKKDKGALFQIVNIYRFQMNCEVYDRK